MRKRCFAPPLPAPPCYTPPHLPRCYRCRRVAPKAEQHFFSPPTSPPLAPLHSISPLPLQGFIRSCCRLCRRIPPSVSWRCAAFAFVSPHTAQALALVRVSRLRTWTFSGTHLPYRAFLSRYAVHIYCTSPHRDVDTLLLRYSGISFYIYPSPFVTSPPARIVFLTTLRTHFRMLASFRVTFHYPHCVIPFSSVDNILIINLI